MPELSSQLPPHRYASFAIAIPLYRVFDYAIEANDPAIVGTRYRLPFGKGHKIGVLLSVSESSTHDSKKIKPVLEALDPAAVISTDMLKLARWMASYYLQPPGDVLFQCLPKYLRGNQAQKPSKIKVWFAEPVDADTRMVMTKRSPRQAELFEALESAADGLNAAQLKQVNANWHGVVLALESKSLIRWQWSKSARAEVDTQPAPELHAEQLQVVEAIGTKLDKFAVHLLDGITGSGKTEVYFQLIEYMLEQKRQIIYLVPEIGLTSQLVERVTARFGNRFAISHSG